MRMLDRFSLREQVIVVTGASSGIGRAIAVACADAGATVAAIGRNRPRLEELQKELNSLSPAPHYIVDFDVTDFKKIPGAVAQIVLHCGKISGFVHAAGVALTCPLNIMTAEAYYDIYAVNVIAGFEFAKIISAKKFLAPPASFLFIASVSGIKGEPGLLAYSASKGAILSGIRSMAAELGGKGVRVNAIIPGLIIDTPMGQNTHSELPEDAAALLQKKHCLGFGKTDSLTGGAIYFLSSASNWTTGSALTIDGGYTL